MSERERKVLEALARFYSDDFGFLSFAAIAVESGVELQYVRRTVRALARKGFARYARGLWGMDGEPAGAGYAATKAGVAQLEEAA